MNQKEIPKLGAGVAMMLKMIMILYNDDDVVAGDNNDDYNVCLFFCFWGFVFVVVVVEFCRMPFFVWSACITSNLEFILPCSSPNTLSTTLLFYVLYRSLRSVGFFGFILFNAKAKIYSPCFHVFF